MSFIKRWKGKYVTINPDNPSALGICDESGFVFNHKDLVKQMEWRGNNLVWTGLMVGPPYVDKPSQQNRPPIVKGDPKPVKNPRLPKDYTNPDDNPVLPNKELEQKLKNTKWNE
jgi:hypothetical protein